MSDTHAGLTEAELRRAAVQEALQMLKLVQSERRTKDAWEHLALPRGRPVEPRVDERADEPRPHRALMIGRVSRPQIAVVRRPEIRVI